jgi:hypothetical protein
MADAQQALLLAIGIQHQCVICLIPHLRPHHGLLQITSIATANRATPGAEHAIPRAECGGASQVSYMHMVITAYESYLWYRTSLDVVRLRNRGASAEARVHYPLGTDYVALGNLAETVSEALEISSMY